MSFPRYTKYKDSGVEWLGEVPEHWEVKRLKEIARVSGGGTPSREVPGYWGGEIPWVSPKDMKAEEIHGAEESITALGLSESTSSLHPPGRVLIVIRSGILQRVIPVAINAVSVSINQDLKALAFTPAACVPAFFLRWVQGLNDSLLLAWAQQGATVESINQSLFLNTAIPMPSLPEQAAIAAFLDRETAKIDALIAEQQRLIKLLQEKRQSVISHAVTKGLNPDAPMKDSGIEWLGEVPEHWDCASLIRIAQRVVVGIAEAATHAYVDDGTPILRSTNIKGGSITGEVLMIDPAFAADRGSKAIRAGDLVTVRTGNAGATAVAPQGFDGCQCFTMLVTTLKDGFCPDFYGFWMNSVAAQTYFQLEGWGTAQVNISVPILKALPIPMPPESEQQDIVDLLLDAIAEGDAVSQSGQHAITLRQERRSALISAAVTGQIDVRGLAGSEAA